MTVYERTRHRAAATALIAVLLTGPGCIAATGSAAAPDSWQVVFDWVRGQSDQLATDLGIAHATFLARAEAESPELVERLEPAPPALKRPGWGVLPTVLEDGPDKPVRLLVRRYDLGAISLNFARSFRDGRVLALHTAARADAPLEPAVATYERLHADLKNLEQHLAYHEWWQKAAVEQQAFFAGRNEILARLRSKRASDNENTVQLSREELAELAPFSRAAGLAVTADNGALTLPVTVHTDIDDAAFLEAFRNAVARHWNNSAAAQQRRFSIELQFVQHKPAELYPEQPPEPGQKIDLDAHVARFPDNALVMTTGAASTHAWRGRSLLLGPGPVRPRLLAHEFGHLLGFSDAYLRGYDGNIGDPNGVVFVEWSGLVDDLMGSPGGGRVTGELVEQLIEAYRKPATDPVIVTS